MKQPLVTIIMPSYNAQNTISKAIFSVLAQDYQNIELIVVNDGSTDDTEKIARNIKDNRIIILSQKNKGLSGARNTGLTYAKGDYVTFIDSDDWVDKDFISSFLHSMLENNADLTICGMIREHPSFKQKISFIQSDSYPDCLRNERFLSLFEGGLINSCCNKLYRTDLIHNNNLSFSGKTLVEDIEFNLKYLQKSGIVNTIAKCPYHYLMGNESLTSKVSEEMFENYILVQKQFLDALNEKDKDIANRFVYHQYISIFMRYLKRVALKSLNAKDVYPILEKYISNPLVKVSFNSHISQNYKELFIHHCIRMKFFLPIIIYLRLKNARPQ